MKFTAEHVLAFQRLSYDLNPLHTDPGYSRATQFGRPVVYGMCGVLAGLAHWAAGRQFRLKEIKGKFAKPLFQEEDYTLSISGTDRQVTVQCLKGQVVQSSFNFVWDDYPGEPKGASATLSAFTPRAQAQDPDLAQLVGQWKPQPFSYSASQRHLAEALRTLGLRADQMPRQQLDALAGSSYFIGMELPGRQALYAGFEFLFDDGVLDASPGAFRFNVEDIQRDERLNRISINGSGTGIQFFALNAFHRPKPVHYSIDDIRQEVGDSQDWKGKAAFVSGATRGFGSVIASMLALQGANLIANYRGDRSEAAAAFKSLSEAEVCWLAGDVTKAKDCSAMREEIRARHGKLDLLVINAFPHIDARIFAEQSSEEFSRFVCHAISTFSVLLHELLPLVCPGGMVVGISTIYTQFPAAQFSHYIAAKSAMEGLLRVLALEHPDQRFALVRPPRMLTDQTNLAFDLHPPVSPVEVGGKLLKAILAPCDSSNLIEADLA